MNIFETISAVNRRSEPFHSQFLVDALDDSLKGDRTLFDAIWKLAAPAEWEIPECAISLAEEVVERGRVDICLRSDKSSKRVVGIEVKTSETSAEPGQLKRYLVGLKEKYPGHDVQVSYLTPFNRDRACSAAGQLRTVQMFEEFRNTSPDARHLSWLDVADIDCGGGVLWEQHRSYVRQHISPKSRLVVRPRLKRGLACFFGQEAAEGFRDALWNLSIELNDGCTVVNLSDFRDDLPSFARAFVKALAILLDSDNVSHNARRADNFSADLRRRFLDSEYREVHVALFGLSNLYSNVWIKGDRNYGVRTARKRRPKSVSILRSNDPERLEVGHLR